MRILLTGGAGFIGSSIAEVLDGTGHQIRVIDVRPAAAYPTHWTQAAPGLELVQADLRDPGAVGKALTGIDAVCHQAAKVGLGLGAADAPDYVACNDLATAVLLAGMARAGVTRLVLASSMVVYGEGGYRCPRDGSVRPGDRLPADLRAGRFEPACPRCGGPLTSVHVGEDAPTNPRNIYASTKLAQEHLAASWARLTGGRAVALRYHNVYGPRMPRDTPYAGVAAIFRSALLAGRPPRVFEDGRQLRDFVHVTDIAHANLAALAVLESGAGPGPGELRAYNAGSGQPHTVGEMAAALARALGGPAPVVTGEYRLGDVRHIVASSDRIIRELGWRAQVPFDAGMAEFAQASSAASTTSR